MKYFLTALTAAALSFITGCSEKKLPEIQPPYILANLINYPYTPFDFNSIDLSADSIYTDDEIKVVRPGELKDYVGESAETYFQYQFIGLTSRNFYYGSDTLFVEIAQFVGNENAYGFYSRLRPDGTVMSKIGAESYTEGNSLYIYKGEYYAAISCTNITDPTVAVITKMAKLIDAKIDGGKTLPVYFMMFPSKGKIDPSSKYFAYQYLGIPGFDKVYTVKYQTGEAVFTLFVTMDSDTLKYDFVKHYADSLGKTVEVKKFPFDQGYSAAFKHPEAGLIVAGRVRGKLVGVVGYSHDIDERFVKTWIKGMQ